MEGFGGFGGFGGFWRVFGGFGGFWSVWRVLERLGFAGWQTAALKANRKPWPVALGQAALKAHRKPLLEKWPWPWGACWRKVALALGCLLGTVFGGFRRFWKVFGRVCKPIESFAEALALGCLLGKWPWPWGCLLGTVFGNFLERFGEFWTRFGGCLANGSFGKPIESHCCGRFGPGPWPRFWCLFEKWPSEGFGGAWRVLEGVWRVWRVFGGFRRVLEGLRAGKRQLCKPIESYCCGLGRGPWPRGACWGSGLGPGVPAGGRCLEGLDGVWRVWTVLEVFGRVWKVLEGYGAALALEVPVRGSGLGPGVPAGDGVWSVWTVLERLDVFAGWQTAALKANRKPLLVALAQGLGPGVLV